MAATLVTAILADEPVKLRVPLGLPDPTPFIPKDNSLTLAKWELGRRLFYDQSYLTPQGKTSCATCHKPADGFADHQKNHDGFNTPTLLNCVYNKHQFWDGRATYLEEVVQQTLEDERAAGNADAVPPRVEWCHRAAQQGHRLPQGI